MLVIVLRGALDGLGAVAPVGDPDWIGLREIGPWVLDGKTPALPLDAFFALNPAMPNLHRMYKAEQLPSCTPRRRHIESARISMSGRSREAGSPARAVDTGWLNRALVALASDGQVDLRAAAPWRRVGNPLVVRARPCDVRGCAAIAPRQRRHAGPLGWTCISTPIPDLQLRLRRGYASPRLGPPEAPTIQCPTELRCHRLALRACVPISPTPLAQRRAFSPRRTARVSGRWLVGWDTHINEGAASGQLANLLGALDGALARPSRPTWAKPGARRCRHHHGFGRTARINGTDGTDHGTGTLPSSPAAHSGADAWSPTGRD